MVKIKEKQSRGSLYARLVASYVLFSLLVVMLFAACLIIVSSVVSRGNLAALVPYTLADRESCEKGLPAISNLGGWIEDLDGDYRVRQVLGEKKTAEESYTPRELFRLTGSNMEPGQKFIGFLNEKKDGDGYYLVILGRTEIQVDVKVLYGPQNTNPAWQRLFLLIFTLLFAGMCGLMALFLNRRIKRPLEFLSGGMERIRRGESGVRLSFQAEAEFARIRDTFNMMSGDLETARREKADVERKKNKMLLELSHDIRTPIATISSFAVALEQGLVREVERGKYYETIRRKAERVNLLTEELFTMLKMQSSEYELNLTREELCEFLRRVCTEYYGEAQEKGLEMTVEIPERRVMAEADYTLLGRAIGNLLSNAVKYNRTGREISVTLDTFERPDDSSDTGKPAVCIEVADDGERIPEELERTLFDDFVRGDSARRTDGGTGLGLAIARAIARRHGGELTYRYEDGRNRFRLQLSGSVCGGETDSGKPPGK